VYRSNLLLLFVNIFYHVQGVECNSAGSGLYLNDINSCFLFLSGTYLNVISASVRPSAAVRKNSKCRKLNVADGASRPWLLCSDCVLKKKTWLWARGEAWRQDGRTDCRLHDVFDSTLDLEFLINTSYYICSNFARRVPKTAESDYQLRLVCPSVCPHGTARLPLDGFSSYLIFERLSTICRVNLIFISINNQLDATITIY